MSCPSWSRLVAHRYGDPAAREPEGWGEALEHLGVCPVCREEAVAADPTLVLRRLPDERLGTSDVQRIRAGVDALRRASRVETQPPAGVIGRVRGASAAVARRGRWLAAAAVLAAALLSVHPHDSATVSPDPVPVGAQVRSPGGEPAVASSDDIDRPTASFYHLDDGDLTVTMVVDPALDV